VEVYELLKLATMSIVRFLTDQITIRIQADLRALGYFLHHPLLAAAFSPAQIHTLVAFLCDRVVSGTNKVEVSLCVWMIAVQNLSAQLILPHAKRLLETLHVAAFNTMRSNAIEFEALNVRGDSNMVLRPLTQFLGHRRPARWHSNSDPISAPCRQSGLPSLFPSL
jgi:hypothetical protein